ncbi:hypothetical protein H4Q26_014730 [Puccinia striiformis f. sp. tritici PST-130]|nr:hypothetical protein H4Q26_014730 [Puccinia striiformis f. sp. tritici PST-130]
MPPRKRKNSTATSAALETQTNTPTSTPAAKKKKSIPWDKDAVNPGFSSHQETLQSGEERREEVLANEIVQKLAAQGINHCIARDIRTKITELQMNFTCACDFLRNTGQGILAEDVANGTDNIRAGVIKRCKYYYDLEEVMAVRANANPQDTIDSTSELVPNLLADHDHDKDPDPLLSLLTGHNAELEESETDGPPGPTGGVNDTPSPAPDSAVAKAGSRSKSNSKKAGLPQGLEKAISDTYEYRYKNLTSKETREKNRLDSKDQRERKRIKLEARRVRIEEMDGKARMANAEAEQARLQVACMKDLKDTGFTDDQIKSFINCQFGKRVSRDREDDTSDSNSDTDSDSNSDLL